MRYLILCFALSSGCAFTYAPPETPPAKYEVSHDLPAEEAARRVRLILIEQGYTPTASSADLIATDKQMASLTAADADCGTTMGLAYIDDERTETLVQVRAIPKPGAIVIATQITGEYLKSDPVQSKSFTCVSKGTIERRIIEAFESR